MKKLLVPLFAWPGPKHFVVGEDNKTLPLLMLTLGETSRYRTGVYQDRVLVAGKDRILAALSERHGFPDPHHP